MQIEILDAVTPTAVRAEDMRAGEFYRLRDACIAGAVFTPINSGVSKYLLRIDTNGVALELPGSFRREWFIAVPCTVTLKSST